VQIRDVPEPAVEALKAQAKERGLTLAGYQRAELNQLAGRPTNAQVVERMRQ
jgi:antitoxin FitA